MSDTSRLTPADSNADRVRAAYRQWEISRGHDPVPFFDLADDHIEMSSVLEPSGLGELAAGHRGIDRMRDYFAALADEWDMIDYPCEDVVAAGDTVIWIGRSTWRNKRTGSLVKTPKVDIWTFRGDKAVRYFEMFDTLGFARAMGVTFTPPPVA